MAKCLNYESQIQQGNTIQSWHVSQSVDAFTGAQDYDITISGSLTLTGSAYLNPGKILSTGQEYVLTYNNTTGQIFKALSTALGGGEGFNVYQTGSDNNNIIPSKFGDNGVNGQYAVVLGGSNNTASGASSFIGAGTLNTASSACSFIGGGCSNEITTTDGSGQYSIIVGGRNNSVSSYQSTYNIVIGGVNNSNSGRYGGCQIIVGGSSNSISGYSYNSIIGSGASNTISSGYCGIIVGGLCNAICGNLAYNNASVIVGGSRNIIISPGSDSSYFGFIGGGSRNKVNSDYTSIVGGILNTGSGACSFIGGGNCNIAGGSNSIIVGGTLNSASATFSTIVGGTLNTGSSPCLFIGGGESNSISGNYGCLSVLVGGLNNSLSDVYCGFIGGGANNSMEGSTSGQVIVGGSNNSVSGGYSGILGGENNTVSHDCSFIIGANLTSDKACYTFMNNLDVEGTVSASIFSGSFVGDGSGLTGISGGGGSGDYSPFITGSVSTGILPTVGSNCTTLGLNSTIAGGTLNTASSNCSFIGGGCGNSVSAYSDGYSIVVGGKNNNVDGNDYGTIVGGQNNTISTDYAGHNFIGGGCNNAIDAAQGNYNNVIVGGVYNCITGNADGGSNNGILGGKYNLIGNFINNSFIIGSNLTASADCTTFMNNLDVEGTVSASIFSGSFVGDGSGLTGTGGGSSITLQDNGSSCTTSLSTLNFIGAKITEPTPDDITVEIPVSSSAESGNTAVTEIVTLSQAQYDGLTPSNDVLYVIV